MMLKEFIFLNFSPPKNPNKIKFFKYERTVKKLNPKQALIGSDRKL
tara:strand:+ start:399 stop:536 length:138 start_codon:yes stop_codon:yes gene_type:complete